jgi:predicted ribosomally synthesized peptide with nif11-like leader
MSTEQAYVFFREVYSDPLLQSKLFNALVVQSPEVVLHIARECGYPIDADDMAATLGETKSEADFQNRPEAIAESVMGRDFWNKFLRAPVWKNPDELRPAFNPFKSAPPFRMTIPGPSWVNSPHMQVRADVDPTLRPSAVEVFEELE